MNRNREFFVLFVAVILLGFLYSFFNNQNQPIEEFEIKQSHTNSNRIQLSQTPTQPQETIQNKFFKLEAGSSKKINKPRRTPSALPLILPEELIEDEALAQSPWKIWTQAYSILKSEYVDGQVIVTEISNRYVLQSNEDQSNLSDFKASRLIVVYNKRLKKIGLLSGYVTVVTTRKDLLEQKIKDLKATIVNSFDSIHTYFVTGQESEFNLRELFNTLKAQSFVSHIELDVIDRSYEKN